VDAKRRIEYLQVLGVDVWLPRRPNAAAAPLETPIPASVPAAPAALEPVPAVEVAKAAEPAAIGAIFGSSDASAVSRRAPAAAARQHVEGEEAAASWDALRKEILTCTKCGLHATRTQGVVGVGDQRAEWLVIGEAPGAEEDKRGEPFVGRGGQLLDAMLRAIALKRGENVYIANILKSRPPNNRDPKPEEVTACLPYLMRQIALIRPRLILAVGRIAAQNLLSTDAPLGRLRGRVHYFGELNTPVIVTYHPAYLLRSPAEKRKAWDDLKFARGLYRQLTQGT
jgi:uracil-DNA glycosylase family 4